MIDGYSVSTSQAARFLGVTEKTVIRWYKKGDLLGRRNDRGHYFFNLDDLKEIKAERDDRSINYYQTGQLADHLGCDVDTIYSYVEWGIPHTRDELGAYLFNKEEVFDWIDKFPKYKKSLMTSRQAASYLGVPHEVILELNNKNIFLPSLIIQGYPHFKRMEVETWLESLGKDEGTAKRLSDVHLERLKNFEESLKNIGKSSSAIETIIRFTNKFIIWYASSFELFLKQDLLTPDILNQYDKFLENHFDVSKATSTQYSIGIRPYISWAVKQGIFPRDPDIDKVDVPDLRKFYDWLIKQGYTDKTAKSYKCNVQSFFRWFYYVSDSPFTSSITNPDNYTLFWAHHRLVKRMNLNSRSAMQTAMKKFSSYGLDRGEIKIDPWKPLTFGEQKIEGVFREYLEEKGMTPYTIKHRINAFRVICAWHKNEKEEEFNLGTFSLEDLPSLKTYMKDKRGLTKSTIENYLRSARNMLDWTGKLPDKPPMLELDPKLEELLEKCQKKAKGSWGYVQIGESELWLHAIALHSILFLNKGNSFHATNKETGAARESICKWVFQLEEVFPVQVRHNIQRPSLEASIYYY